MTPNAYQINNRFVFILALVGIIFFPGFHLSYFAPYLVIAFYRYTRFALLWRAIGCGTIIDIFSATPYFGLNALNYFIISWILYGQKQNFFEDKQSTIPLMTLFFSILSTITSYILFLFFTKTTTLTFKWFLTDIIIMPFIDATYAYGISLFFQITNYFRKFIQQRRMR
ncbi:MAG: rod shape-determining protein MreD [Chlamydiales bacterium]